MIVSAEGLSVRRQGRDILSDVEVTLAPGEIVALIGANGAGKSTLLRSLNGLVRPSRGRIVLDGRPIGQLSQHEIARLVAYMPPQQAGESSDCTLVDCVLAGRFPHRDGQCQSGRQIVFETMARLGILELADRRMQHLSGGERQRAHLARALVQEPRLLLLDEPTSALDLRRQLETLQLLSEIAHQGGVTVVIVLHDLTSAMRHADRVLLLSRGRCLADGPPAILTPELILRAYGVVAEVAMLDGHAVIIPLRSAPPDGADAIAFG